MLETFRSQGGQMFKCEQSNHTDVLAEHAFKTIQQQTLNDLKLKSADQPTVSSTNFADASRSLVQERANLALPLLAIAWKKRGEKIRAELSTWNLIHIFSI